MAPPAYFNIVDRYDRLTDKLETAAIERVNDSIEASYLRLEKEIRRKYRQLQDSGGSVAVFALQLNKFRELRNLLSDIIPEAEQDKFEKIYTDLIAATGEYGAAMATDALKSIAPKGFPLEEFGGIPIEAAIAQAQEGVKRLYRYSTEFQTKASAIVEQGIIRGWGVKRVELLLRNELELTKSKAETIARTEVMSAYNDAARSRYKGVVKYVTWLAVPSAAMCSYCAHRNGRVYRLDQVIIPLHPRDRCTLLPADPTWRDMDLMDEEFLAEYHDRGVKELNKRGLKPNPGLAPFEKAAGLKSSPKAAWELA